MTIGSAVFEFTEPLNGGALPYLDSVTGPQIQARAGYITGLGVGEAPSMTAVICNDPGGHAAKILSKALRCRADHYEDDGSLSFPGVISAISYATDQITLTIGG